MSLDWSLCRREPRPHQREGVELILAAPSFALFDQMGVGKTKQRVDACQFEYVDKKIDTVVVVCPAQVGSVWGDLDPDVGELVKDMWPSVDHEVHKFCSRTPEVRWRPGALNWVVVNYEFLRDGVRTDKQSGRVTGPHLDSLTKQLVGRKFTFIAEESGAVKGWKSQQTTASYCVRYQRGVYKASLLNGTPVDHSPLDMYAQGRVLWPGIFPQRNYFHFRAHYAIMGGFRNKVVLSYQNLDDLRERFRPYCARRLKKDVWDLSDKIVMPPLEVPMDAAQWRLYKDLRDDAVASLGDGGQVLAESGALKVLRLLQVCNGFLGGVEYWDHPGQLGLDWTDEEGEPGDREDGDAPPEVAFVSDAKTRAVVDWALKLEEREKAVVWCRFRRQVADVVEGLRAAGVEAWPLLGGQRAAERREVVARFGPAQIDAPWRGCLVGVPSAGGLGLNFTAASHTLYASNEWSLRFRLQTEDRVHRPPQKYACDYTDVLACGPDGQRTVEHHVRAGLLRKENVAAWTCAAWERALRAA